MFYSKISVLFSALLISFFSFSVQADISKLKDEIDEAIKNESQFIENSYIIKFRDLSPSSTEKPLIDPPDESKRGELNVPFGEHSTGQSKESLAIEMGLNGEVISIFETINAVHVKMDAQEAERWKKDERVEYVEQDMLATTGATAVNPDWRTEIHSPSYQDGILTIPRVDTPEQAGNFQDAMFQFDDQAGVWRLLDYKVKKINVPLENTNVELIITDSFPVQVFLKVSGEFSSDCGYFFINNKRLKDGRFEVIMHISSVQSTNQLSCFTAVTPFEEIIPLSVYGLNAGTYEYSINGGDIGTFTLTEDNKL